MPFSAILPSSLMPGPTLDGCVPLLPKSRALTKGGCTAVTILPRQIRLIRSLCCIYMPATPSTAAENGKLRGRPNNTTVFASLTHRNRRNMASTNADSRKHDTSPRHPLPGPPCEGLSSRNHRPSSFSCPPASPPSASPPWALPHHPARPSLPHPCPAWRPLPPASAAPSAPAPLPCPSRWPAAAQSTANLSLEFLQAPLGILHGLAFGPPQAHCGKSMEFRQAQRRVSPQRSWSLPTLSSSLAQRGPMPFLLGWSFSAGAPCQ